MRRWKAWIAGALALAGLGALPSAVEARTTTVPELIPLSTPAQAGPEAAAAPTCQYGYYRHGWRGRHFYGRPYGWHRRYGWRRHYGWRRPYYGYRRPFYHRRLYRPIGFYGRPYGYGYRHYGYRHYGW